MHLHRSIDQLAVVLHNKYIAGSVPSYTSLLLVESLLPAPAGSNPTRFLCAIAFLLGVDQFQDGGDPSSLIQKKQLSSIDRLTTTSNTTTSSRFLPSLCRDLSTTASSALAISYSSLSLSL